MIIATIMKLFLMVASTIINLVSGILPDNPSIETILDAIDIMLEWTTQAINFMYFLFGDTLFVVVPIATGILIAKYTIIPLVTIFRSFFINSNE